MPQSPGGNSKRRRQHRRQPPGIPGGKAHKPGQEKRQRERRENDPRIQAAREEQRANEALLEAMIQASLVAEARASVALDHDEHAQTIALPAAPMTVLPEVRPEEPVYPAQEAAQAFLAAPRTPEAVQEALEAASKRETWSLEQARDLLLQGYTLESTVARTGWTAEQIIGKDRS